MGHANKDVFSVLEHFWLLLRVETYVEALAGDDAKHKNVNVSTSIRSHNSAILCLEVGVFEEGYFSRCHVGAWRLR